MDEILQDLVPVMKKEFGRKEPTAENLYDYFLSRSRDNLHVALCFSPVSSVSLIVSQVGLKFKRVVNAI